MPNVDYDGKRQSVDRQCWFRVLTLGGCYRCGAAVCVRVCVLSLLCAVKHATFLFLDIIQQLAAMRGATLIRISRGQRVHRTWRWVFKIKVRRWNWICLQGVGLEGGGGKWVVEGAENNRFKNVARKVFWAQRQNTLLFRLLTDVVVFAAAIVVIAVRHLEF